MPGKAEKPDASADEAPLGADGPDEPREPHEMVEPIIDPFIGHERFASEVTAHAIKTWFDRPSIEPMEPLETQADKILDLEAIAAHSEWSGTFVAPREKRADELPIEIEEQMRQKERQFILRNLSRKVMFTDPDEPLPFSNDEEEQLTLERAYRELTDLPLYAPVEMLGEMNLDIVKDEMRLRRWLLTLDWTRHFGKEIRDDWDGAMWRYDPDARRPVHDDEEDDGTTSAGLDQGPP